MEPSPESSAIPVPLPRVTSLEFRSASWAWRHRSLLHLGWACLAVVALGAAVVWDQGASRVAVGGVVLLSAAIVITGWAVARWQARRRWTVRLDEGGLVITTGGRSDVVAFAAVRAFSVDSKRVTFNGKTRGSNPRVHIHADSGRWMISARLEDSADERAMRDLVEALRAGCARHAREHLAGGGSIEGAGWRADARGISSVLRGRMRTVPWEDVALHEKLGAAHLFWAQDAVRPWLRVPAASRNASLLAALAVHAETPPDADGPHGRLLWEFKSDQGTMIAGGIALAVGLVAAGWLVWEGENPDGVLLIAGLGGAMCLMGWIQRSNTAFHERGVIARRGRQRRELPYAAAAAFRYQREVHSEAGLHVGIKGALSIVPRDGGPPVVAVADLHGVDADEPIVFLRDRLTRQWQPRLLEQLESTGSVEWIPGVRLRREGVQLDPGPGVQGVLPWTRVRTGWSDAHEQEFLLMDGDQLEAKGAGAPVLARLDANAGGFHAGLKLFHALWRAGVVNADAARAAG